MAYVLVAIFVPLFLFAEFDQECRFIRIARKEYISRRDLLAQMAADKPTVWGTAFLVGSFVALAAVLELGYRLPSSPFPFVIVVLLLFAAAFLKLIGFKRLSRSQRG